jgi:L-aminopeptidase/D-esterase-like protein
MLLMYNSITDIPGIKVGHSTNFSAITGCTVIICENGAVCGVDVRGGAPGTRETDLLRPMNLVEKIHAICLTGGSAFGLDSACGVMQYLEEKGFGFDVLITKVPIVPCAVIFDLGIGNYKIRPDKGMGYEACLNSKTGYVEQGSVGAGCGATVGKIYGVMSSTKAGVGTSSIELSNGVVVGAIVVVNSFGDVVDEKGEIIAGAHSEGKFLNTKELMKKGIKREKFTQNTTLAVVATNAKLNKEQVNKLAQVSHNGIAKVISPSHTMLDGDTTFALSYGDKNYDLNTICLSATEAVSSAIINSIKVAKSLGGVPSWEDIKK